MPIEGSNFEIEADTIIGAIGQSTNTQFLYNDLPVKLNKWGDIEINGKTSQTSESNIFAGGDCVTGPATVIQAVAAGRRAAEAIDSFLMKGYVPESHIDYSCSRGSMEDLPKWDFEHFPRLKRAKMPSIDLKAREGNFKEVELGLSEEAAREESRRPEMRCNRQYNCDLKRGFDYNVECEMWFIVRDHNKCISCGRCMLLGRG